MKIKIANEADRITVAGILIKNGYKVQQGKILAGKKNIAVLIAEDVKSSGGERFESACT